MLNPSPAGSYQLLVIKLLGSAAKPESTTQALPCFQYFPWLGNEVSTQVFFRVISLLSRLKINHTVAQNREIPVLSSSARVYSPRVQLRNIPERAKINQRPKCVKSDAQRPTHGAGNSDSGDEPH